MIILIGKYKHLKNKMKKQESITKQTSSLLQQAKKIIKLLLTLLFTKCRVLDELKVKLGPDYENCEFFNDERIKQDSDLIQTMENQIQKIEEKEKILGDSDNELDDS